MVPTCGTSARGSRQMRSEIGKCEIEDMGPTDSCRKCSTGQENHSAECRQRFEKIQYDLLQEKLRQAPIIPEDSGEQTVVTPAPAASETEPGVTESSSAPSASERIRQKRSGRHGPVACRFLKGHPFRTPARECVTVNNLCHPRLQHGIARGWIGDPYVWPFASIETTPSSLS